MTGSAKSWSITRSRHRKSRSRAIRRLTSATAPGSISHGSPPPVRLVSATGYDLTFGTRTLFVPPAAFGHSLGASCQVHTGRLATVVGKGIMRDRPSPMYELHPPAHAQSHFP